MHHFNFSLVLKNLKKCMKEKKFTYADLAKEMGISESGLKKILTGDDCSLQRLAQICHALDISLAELLKVSDKFVSEEILFTQQQEDALLANPSLFGFFWELVKKSEKEIKHAYNLDDNSVQKYLLNLDKLGLIELLPGNKVKHRYSAAARTHWSMTGNLGRWAMSHFQMGFLKKMSSEKDSDSRRSTPQNSPQQIQSVDSKSRFKTTAMKPETFAEMCKAVDLLLNEFQERAHREQNFSDLTSLKDVGILFAAGPFQFSDILEIKRRGAKA